jgi:hypothetical protein
MSDLQPDNAFEGTVNHRGALCLCESGRAEYGTLTCRTEERVADVLYELSHASSWPAAQLDR